MKRSELSRMKKRLLLYKTLVQTVFLYGVGNWELKERPKIERVQARYMKMAMGIDGNTQGYIWRMELGQMATSTIAKKE